MKKIILILLICTNSLIAQTAKKENASLKFANSIQESIYVHTNSSVLLTGETLFYKLYCLNSMNLSFSDVSKIAYVELIDHERKSVFKQKLLLNKGVSQGDIFIPTTLNSGSYKLIAYTNWMLNYNSPNMYSEDFVIINPFQSKISIPEVQSINNDIKLNPFTFDKKTYSNRELVKIKLNKQNQNLENGKYSISIKKIDELKFRDKYTAQNFVSKNTTIPESKNNNFYTLPEVRGETIRGNIIANDNKTNLEDITIALSIPGKSFDFKITTTNNKGEFIFILDASQNASNAIIQVFEDNRHSYKVELKESTFNYSNLEFLKTKDIPSDLKTNIEKRSIANQIENAYFSIKKDTIKENALVQPFYFPIAKDISLDDYTRFSTIKETIIEILPNVFFREKDGIFTINLRDKLTNGSESGYTLVLIDGILIQNVKELFDYSSKNIDKVSFIREKYVFGPKIFNGVINFITKKQDYQLKENGDFILNSEIKRPLNIKYYYNQEYSDSLKYDRIPDYRHQLLWNPNLTSESLESEIKFYTSDIKGKYKIIIEGFTDKGSAISITDSFEVK